MPPRRHLPPLLELELTPLTTRQRSIPHSLVAGHARGLELGTSRPGSRESRHTHNQQAAQAARAADTHTHTPTHTATHTQATQPAPSRRMKKESANCFVPCQKKPAPPGTGNILFRFFAPSFFELAVAARGTGHVPGGSSFSSLLRRSSFVMISCFVTLWASWTVDFLDANAF